MKHRAFEHNFHNPYPICIPIIFMLKLNRPKYRRTGTIYFYYYYYFFFLFIFFLGGGTNGLPESLILALKSNTFGQCMFVAHGGGGGATLLK